MINSKDISVVVQGAVDKKLTPKCLKSIRKYLPEAQIILSTWEGSDVDGLDYDELVLSKDPGNEICDDTYGTKDNVNRQILSSKNGLLKVRTIYALKIRSDMEIINNNFVIEFEKHINYKRCDDFKITKNRIIINNLYCADPNITKFPFHISDWFQFGLTQDVLNLWNIPLQKEPMGSRYFNFNSKNPQKIDRMQTCIFQYIPEQYITLSFIRKNKFNIDMNYYFDYTIKNIEQTYEFFANNFVILDYKNCGIHFCKYNPYKHDYTNQMSYFKWLEQYQKYCDPDFIVPLRYSWQEILHLTKYIGKVHKHSERFLKPFKIIADSLFAFISCMYYILRIVTNIIIFSPRVVYKFIKKTKKEI